MYSIWLSGYDLTYCSWVMQVILYNTTHEIKLAFCYQKADNAGGSVIWVDTGCRRVVCENARALQDVRARHIQELIRDESVLKKLSCSILFTYRNVPQKSFLDV